MKRGWLYIGIVILTIISIGLTGFNWAPGGGWPWQPKPVDHAGLCFVQFTTPVCKDWDHGKCKDHGWPGGGFPNVVGGGFPGGNGGFPGGWWNKPPKGYWTTCATAGVFNFRFELVDVTKTYTGTIPPGFKYVIEAIPLNDTFGSITIDGIPAIGIGVDKYVILKGLYNKGLVIGVGSASRNGNLVTVLYTDPTP
jgi:hypothetical protein